MSDGITVRGIGQVTAVPDQARISIGVEAAAPTAGDAQAAASARTTAVLATLREAAIAERDIASQRIALSPTYDYSGDTPRMTGYSASQRLSVRTRELDALGRVIDRAITAGATVVDDISLEVADPGPAQAGARQLAMTDARARAEALAQAAGVTLGRAVNVVEGPRGAEPRPFAKARAELMAAAADTPIAAGSTDVVVEVEVTFAILG
jgi:uncharacterized protein YggE